MLHLSLHCNILVIFVVTLLCMPPIKCFMKFTPSCPILWRLPNFSCVHRLPETCLSTADTYMQGKSCPEGCVFTRCPAKNGHCYAMTINENIFFSVSDHSNVSSNNYYNLKHFKNFKLSFIKYICVSWLFSCELKLFVYGNTHFNV